MCGILGSYNIKDGSLPKKVNAILKYRGPDDYGELKYKNYSLAHWRLSIIDLDTGKQPIYNEDKTLAIIFNGEIYNFQQLKKELINRGHKFSTKTDTEAVIHAYEEYGEEFLKKLEGMFALAILNLKNDSLILARDHIGIKPLYYYFNESKKEFLFASELKAIIQYQDIKKELDLNNVWTYLMFRHSPSPNTVIKNVKKLLPGHYLIFKNNDIKIKKYWEVKYTENKLSYQESKQQLENQLRKSIQSHLIADVPVGIMLSGGVDSTSLVAFAAEKIKNIRTFTIGFAGQKDNEFEYAKTVASQFNAKHQELLIEPKNIKLLPEVIWFNDEPVAGPSSLAYYLMFEQVKKYVKVVLLGHGADEIFCGYEQFKVQKLARKLFKIPLIRPLMEIGAGILAKIFNEDYAFERLKLYLQSFKNKPANYFQLTTVFNFQELDKLIQPSIKRPDYKENKFFTPDILTDKFEEDRSYWNNLLAFEMGGWLSDDLLHRADRMTMAHSIEGRVPFLDRNLIEFVAAVPFRFKLKGYQDKYIFRQTIKSILPSKIFSRKKQRFNTPIHVFFSKEYDNLCLNLFKEKNWLNENFFNQQELLKLLDFKKRFSYRFILKHNKLSAQFYARQIWNIVVLQIWYKLFMENKSIEEIKTYFN